MYVKLMSKHSRSSQLQFSKGAAGSRRVLPRCSPGASLQGMHSSFVSPINQSFRCGPSRDPRRQ